MSRMPRKLVLFDIDGTILLTAGAGRRAITQALADAVRDPAAFERVRFDGKTDPQIVIELLDAAGHATPPDAAYIEAVCERYVRLLERELAHAAARTTLLPGVAALLDALEREAVVLGLVTGNVAGGADLKLRAAGLDPARFRVGAFGSDSRYRPELPPIAVRRAAALFAAPPTGHDVVIIGDTPADVTCGLPIGARSVAVATGGFRAEELHASGAHAVFGDLTETRRVLDAILA